MDISETDKAYLAGLFDSEGCVCITKTKPNLKNKEVNPRYFIVINVSNTHLPVLEWIKLLFGGSIQFKGEVNLPCYAWQTQKDKAVEFLMTIQPYSKIKQAQIQVALQYYEWNKEYKHSGRKPWPESVMNQREEFRSRIKTLNGVATA